MAENVSDAFAASLGAGEMIFYQNACMEINMQIKVYENSLRAESCKDFLGTSRLVSRFAEVILLPIPSTRDGVTLNGCEIPLLDAVSYADEDTLVVGYGIPDEATEVLSSFGSTVCDIAKDEGFLLANAELTALGALSVILDSEKRAPRDIAVGIAGYGRIGRVLADRLMYLGTRVRIFSTREALRMELASLGIESAAFPVRQEELIGLDILVNTAPCEVFSADAQPEGEVRIIDLASGARFPEGVTVERYPSLPARAFPESAGRILGESVERFLLLGGAFGEV